MCHCNGSMLRSSGAAECKHVDGQIAATMDGQPHAMASARKQAQQPVCWCLPEVANRPVLLLLEVLHHVCGCSSVTRVGWQQRLCSMHSWRSQCTHKCQRRPQSRPWLPVPYWSWRVSRCWGPTRPCQSGRSSRSYPWKQVSSMVAVERVSSLALLCAVALRMQSMRRCPAKMPGHSMLLQQRRAAGATTLGVAATCYVFVVA
jgi:hypothetical protein